MHQSDIFGFVEITNLHANSNFFLCWYATSTQEQRQLQLFPIRMGCVLSLIVIKSRLTLSLLEQLSELNIKRPATIYSSTLTNALQCFNDILIIRCKWNDSFCLTNLFDEKFIISTCIDGGIDTYFVSP